jgi:hypothetical protein
MTIDKKQLAEMMGEGEHLRPKLDKYTIVSLNGNDGLFYSRKIGDDGSYSKKAESMGQNVQGVIIAIRMQLSEYNPKFRRSTTEYDKVNEKLKLFETRDGKTSQISEGSVAQLREQYPNLRAIRWMYMLVEGGSKIIKVRIKGGSLTGFFDFLKELDTVHRHTFEVVTEMNPVSLRNESLGKDYYAIKFSIKKDVDEAVMESTIAPKMTEFHSKLSDMKKVFDTLPDRKAAIKEEVDTVTEDMPTITIDEEESANVDDLPF